LISGTLTIFSTIFSTSTILGISITFSTIFSTYVGTSTILSTTLSVGMTLSLYTTISLGSVTT